MSSIEPVLNHYIAELAKVTSDLQKTIALAGYSTSTSEARLALSATDRGSQQTRINLTEREKEILTWVAIGKTDIEIGCVLEISKHTVNMHLRRIYEKVGVNNRILAVTRALTLGLLPI